MAALLMASLAACSSPPRDENANSQAWSIGCGSGPACGEGMFCSGGECVPRAATYDDAGVPQVGCFTPCTDGLTDDAGNPLKACEDGYLKGCTDGLQCVQGSCVAAGTAAPTCAGDNECPVHQACHHGHCYSECELSHDCHDELQCDRHVCRVACGDSAPDCAKGTHCEPVRVGESYCMPDPTPSADPPPAEVEASIKIHPRTFKLTARRPDGNVEVTNEGTRAIIVHVTKVSDVDLTKPNPVGQTKAPLPWMSLGVTSDATTIAPTRTNDLAFTLAAGAKATVQVVNAGAQAMPSKWEGTLKVATEGGEQLVKLGYAAGSDGRWAGTAFSFMQFGETNLAPWLASKNDTTAGARVGNALVQKWIALRNGALSAADFAAAITSVTEGSWKFGAVTDACSKLPVPAPACFPTDTRPEGVAPLSVNLDQTPVPTGVTQLPLVIDVKQSGANVVGKILSSSTLQYPGNPSFTFAFDNNATSCLPGLAACVSTIKMGPAAKAVVGGRYAQKMDGQALLNCSTGFLPKSRPWLVPGFLGGTQLDPNTGYRYRNECVQVNAPIKADPDLSLSLSMANPVPDGLTRVRSLEILDGILLDQTTLYLLTRETFKSFLDDADTAGFSSYGLLVLRRSAAVLSDADFVGTPQTEPTNTKVDLSASCPKSIVSAATGGTSTVDASNAYDVFTKRVSAPAGSDPFVPGDPANPDPAQTVHYLCHDTNKFDTAAVCKVGSGVTYFVGAQIPVNLAGNACNGKSSCQDVLDEWKARYAGSSADTFQVDPLWRCTDATKAYCDADRTDLRKGKTFFKGRTTMPFTPALSAIQYAFRYKTKFANREGTNLAFAPKICMSGSGAVPYCYDAEEIEELRDRIGCATAIFSSYALTSNTFTDVQASAGRTFLQTAMSYSQEPAPVGGIPIRHDGFEQLNAELMIMLGDEAYTAAFQSRFDLANTSTVSFEGSKLESHGIDLSGVAGYEMFTLYQSAQYYQSVLDRFFSLAPHLWKSLRAANQARNFVNAEVVTTYFNRVLRASTQKSRAWSEIGKRYQSFNRADLARGVVQRAYTAAYLESAVMSRMMQGIVSVTNQNSLSEIRKEVDRGALTYRAALLGMRDIHASFTDQLNYFGFAPDYIPFPALQSSGPNAFQTMLTSAKQLAAVAKEKEDGAIVSSHSFNTDAAAFQGELTRIKNTYEGQLGEICGTFMGDDGHVYPAIKTYAEMSTATLNMADPCGMVGNGGLTEALLEVDKAGNVAERVGADLTRHFATIAIEEERVKKQCKAIKSAADYVWKQDGKMMSLAEEIEDAKRTMEKIDRTTRDLGKALELASCIAGTATDCPSKQTAALTWAAETMANAAKQDALADKEREKSHEIAELKRDTARWAANQACDLAKIDSDAKTATLALDLKGLELDMLRAGLDIELRAGQVVKLINLAKRLQAEKEETQQLAIDTEAAKNDPTVRIYKNDAILNADRTFYDALREAYKATKVFEYYTSRSYAKGETLALVRLVARGDYSLEGYLRELEQAYKGFEEDYGNPDIRVARISLMDTILHIPRDLPQDERGAKLHQILRDPKWLSPEGYITLPFSTTSTLLSPLTRVHKILYVHSSLGIAAGKTDQVARLYLRQNGTSVVSAIDGEKRFYRLPPRTAVLNPKINENAATFSPEVYRNEHLRDRPFLNTNWELILNLRDEPANEDIEIDSITDILVDIYYTDFAAL
jgi:hypothetical protein